MDGVTLARARVALTDALRDWLFDPNVSLIGLGWKETEGQILKDTLAVRFHVHKKMTGLQLESADTKPIPKMIGDVVTDVPEGNYNLQYWGWPGWESRPAGSRAGRNDPLVGGISISNERQYGYGTLGSVVRDRSTGELMCLSNWHVLVGDWWALRGQRIFQPGRGDGGDTADTIAALERDAMYANYDAAVAKLIGNRQAVNDQFGLGAIKGICAPQLGLQVSKSGRKSAITQGIVTDIEGSIVLSYRGVERIIRDVLVIDALNQGEEVSAGGDSGSLWLEESSNCAVGLHFAGQNQPERALAMDISGILEALNVELAL